MSKWNLRSIFPSGEAFQNEVSSVETFLEAKEGIEDTILSLQEAGKGIRELEAFVSCLIAEDPSNQEGHEKNARVVALQEKYSGALFNLGILLLNLKENEWEVLRKNPSIREISFFLEELLDLGVCCITQI